MYGNDEPESKSLAEYLADVLNEIGFKARPRIVEGSVYFTTIGNQKTKAQAGFANWFQDFPHPGNFMFLVDGDSIQPTNNQNFGNVDDPKINAMLDEANQNADIDEVAGDYAAGRQEDRRAAHTSCRTAIASSRCSTRSGWTSRTAPCGIPCTTSTSRTSASSRFVNAAIGTAA